MANVRLVVDVTRNDKGELVAAAKELDQVADKQERLTKSTKASESAFRDWGATMLKAFSAGAVLSFMEKSLVAQAEQEAAINKLNLALANQGKFTEELSASLQDFSGEIQATTTYADDAALSLMAMFASFGMGEKEIKRATRAAADFAAATGKSLDEAGAAIAKASTGNVTALQKMGLQFQEGATDAQKFESALRQIEQRFGGSAASATRTYIGQVEQLKNAFGEAQEGLGKFLGTVATAETAFGPLIAFLNGVGKFFGQTLVLVFSEFRAKVIEFNAWLNRQLANFVSGDTGLQATIGGMAGTVLRKALGITQADIDHMRRFADELDKMAEAEREAGNQAAAAAGNIAKAKNSTDDFGRSTKGATKEANELKKAMFEIHLTTAKLAKEVNEDFFAENLRVATIRTQQEMALFQQGLEKEHPLGRQIGSSLSGGLGTFDDKVEKSAKNFQAKFQAAIQAVGVAMQILGVKTESTFAKTFQGAASGALSGAAVGSFFPGAGTAIGGVVGGVLGGVTSFIRARREAEQRALEERAKAEADAVAKLKGLWAEYEAFRKDLAEKGIKGLGDAFAYFLKQGDLSAENLKQLGSVGLATFAALRKAGYSILDAFKMMGPALEEALKAGMSEDGPFGWLVALYRRAQDNEGAVKAIEGLAASFDFLRSTMHITQQQLDEFMGLFATAFTDLIGGAERGTAAYNEGLVLSAGLLFRLWKAAKDYGLALDENTQKMVDDAEAMGLFEDMKDPLDALVEIMNNMLLVLVAIAKVFKVTLPAAVQEYIDKILAIPKIPTPPGMPAPPPDEPPPDTQLAAGAIDRFFPARPGGHLVNVAERGMGEYLTVTHAPMSVKRDTAAPSRTAGPITVNINGYNREPRELAREVAEAISRNTEGAGTAVRIATTGRP